MEWDSTVYALDSTLIDSCLSMSPWAHYRAPDVAVKVHALPDLRGSIPSFIHISDVRLLGLLLPEADAFYVVAERGFVLEHAVGSYSIPMALDRLGEILVG